MTSLLEEKLNSIELPEEKDFQHRYKLRRSLLHCSYFTESHFSIFLNRVRYVLTSRRLVATVTIALVVVVGSSTKIAIENLNMENSLNGTGLDSVSDGSEINLNYLSAENSSNSGQGLSELGNQSAEMVQNDASVNSTLDEDVFVANSEVTSAQKSNNIHKVETVKFLTIEEVTSLLQYAYANQIGTVMLDMDDGMYVFSFEDITGATKENVFNIASFAPNMQLTSQE